MIKCVLFDLDGTIIDSEIYTISSKIIEGKKLGYDIKEEDVISSFGLSKENSKKYYQSLYGKDFPYEELSIYRFKYIIKAMQEGKLNLMPYAVDIIQFLKLHKIKVCLCTSTNMNHLKEYMKYLPILKEFDEYITNDMVENGKPNPDIFLLGMKKCNVIPNEALIIEDAISGVEAGIKTKATTIMVPNIVKPNEFVYSSNAIIMNSLKEVKDYILKVNNMLK